METRSRNAYLDVVRGIAIFSVMWGHSIQQLSYGGPDFFEDRMFMFIYSFHMPLFMLVSGYLFWYSVQSKSLKDILTHRVINLVHPLLVWGCGFQVAINLAVLLLRGVFVEIRTVADAFWGIWFVVAVLELSVSTALVEKLCKESKLKKIVGYGLSAVVFCLFPSRESVLFMMPYFLIGYYFHKIELPTMKYLKKNGLFSVSIGISTAFLILLSFFSRRDYIYTSGLALFSREFPLLEHLSIDLYRWVIGLVGSCAVLLWIYALTAGGTRWSLWPARLGRISLQIYVMQRIFLEWLISRILPRLVALLGYNPLLFSPPIFDLVLTPCVALFYAWALYHTTMWLERKRLSRFLFSR